MGESGWNPNRAKGLPFTSPSPSDSQSQRRRQILLVEDSPADVLLVRKALQSAQVEADIHVVRDGHSATQFFDSLEADGDARCPDLVLLDLNLPRKSGTEVLQHLRAGIKCCNVRVVIVTSSDSEQDRAPAAALGAAAYFKKPSDFEEFMKLGVIVRGLLEG